MYIRLRALQTTQVTWKEKEFELQDSPEEETMKDE
jgi:hypothetical protein